MLRKIEQLNIHPTLLYVRINDSGIAEESTIQSIGTATPTPADLPTLQLRNRYLNMDKAFKNINKRTLNN